VNLRGGDEIHPRKPPSCPSPDLDAPEEPENFGDEDEDLEGSSCKGGSEAGDVSVERGVASAEDHDTFVPNFEDFGMESDPIMQEPSTDVAVSGQKLNLT
jgi:hypothetical protein